MNQKKGKSTKPTPPKKPVQDIRSFFVVKEVSNNKISPQKIIPIKDEHKKKSIVIDSDDEEPLAMKQKPLKKVEKKKFTLDTSSEEDGSPSQNVNNTTKSSPVTTGNSSSNTTPNKSPENSKYNNNNSNSNSKMDVDTPVTPTKQQQNQQTKTPSPVVSNKNYKFTFTPDDEDKKEYNKHYNPPTYIKGEPTKIIPLSTSLEGSVNSNNIAMNNSSLKRKTISPISSPTSNYNSNNDSSSENLTEDEKENKHQNYHQQQDEETKPIHKKVKLTTNSSQQSPKKLVTNHKQSSSPNKKPRAQLQFNDSPNTIKKEEMGKDTPLPQQNKLIFEPKLQKEVQINSLPTEKEEEKTEDEGEYVHLKKNQNSGNIRNLSVDRFEDSVDIFANSDNDNSELDSNLKSNSDQPKIIHLKDKFEDSVIFDDDDEQETDNEDLKKASKHRNTNSSKKKTDTEPKKAKSAVKKPTPKKSKSRRPEIQLTEEEERINLERKLHAIRYGNVEQKPPNLGLKPLPIGKPNCLRNLKFSITGTLDSLERTACKDLILKYGGYVSDSGVIPLSTTHLVKGAENYSFKKVRTAEKLDNCKIIDEDGLFQLISNSLLVSDSKKSKREKSHFTLNDDITDSSDESNIQATTTTSTTAITTDQDYDNDNMDTDNFDDSDDLKIKKDKDQFTKQIEDDSVMHNDNDESNIQLPMPMDFITTVKTEEVSDSDKESVSTSILMKQDNDTPPNSQPSSQNNSKPSLSKLSLKLPLRTSSTNTLKLPPKTNTPTTTTTTTTTSNTSTTTTTTTTPKTLKLNLPTTSTYQQPKANITLNYSGFGQSTTCHSFEDDAKNVTLPLSFKNIKKGHDELWVDKYKPIQPDDIIGNPGAVQTLTDWLKSWNTPKSDHGGKNACLISGPPGIGKTTAAVLISKRLGFDVIELNASDTRNKSQMDQLLSHATTTKSITQFFALPTKKQNMPPPQPKKICLILDEIDGSSGNEDRGGIAEIINSIKQSKVPFICICNDYYSTKLKTLKNYCLDIKFRRPVISMTMTRILQIAKKEGLALSTYMVTKIFESTNNDLRQTINLLQMMSRSSRLSPTNFNNDTINTKLDFTKKDLDTSPFTAAEVLLRYDVPNSHKKLPSVTQKLETFFIDYSLVPMIMQENYLKSMSLQNPFPKQMDAFDLYVKAADSFSESDLLDRAINKNMNWDLLPAYGVTSALIPNYFIRGHCSMPLAFPSYLGKYSNASKQGRFVRELQLHLRSSSNQTCANKSEIRLYITPMLKDCITKPLRGDAKVANQNIINVISFMDSYGMTEDDRNNIIELSTWRDKDMEDPLVNIDKSVKSSFTKKWRKLMHSVYDDELMVTKGSGKSTIDKASVYSELEDGGAMIDDYEQIEEDDNENERGSSLIVEKKSSSKKNNKNNK
ncbi:replication factor C subunit [Tieghemostelium lacteum]|uniref:Replication factor C subunit 1 n=1 Tax=Tieghemostelium lacteum TaxID=361077 RepID=A0A151ZH03_TIELA|nr:replication factor C subunit [Tieghemostelium lacteum]|eukprot:KYQ93253.1 replication factor C subunit [Tieghemostelium lacteum]